MNFQDRSLAMQFVIILVIGIVLLGIAGGYALTHLLGLLDDYDHALQEQVSKQQQILSIENSFKKQVQEWKNVLLRGQDVRLLAKHWGQFEQHEHVVQEHTEQLLPKLTNPQTRQRLQDFFTTHRKLGDAYRAGLDRFKDSGFDPRAGDRAVSGIDREPTKLLEETAELISDEVQDTTERLRQQGSRIMLVTLLLALVAIVVFIVLSSLLMKRQIIGPTRKISTCLSRFADGDFTQADLPQCMGELGQVARSTADVKNHLGQIIRDVTNTAQQLARAAETMTSTTQATRTDLQHQQTEIQQVATAMEQMASVVNQVTDNTHSAADAADAAMSSTRVGRSVVGKSIDEINGLAENVANASQVIQTLEADVANISKVLDVIRGIAEQTNLLALNAAIEAARAGEQGRGFAVVADEVRTLAGRTQDSTREIQAMIEQLESGTSRAVEVMQDSRQRAQRSVEQAASAGTSLGTIDQAVSAINEMNRQIAHSVKEQASVTEEVHRNITRIKDLAEQTSKSSGSMSEAGESVSLLAKDMDQLVNRFKI